MKKSVISFFLALVMIVSVAPNAALAARDDADPLPMESPEETRDTSIPKETPPLQEASIPERIREMERLLTDEDALMFKDALASAEPEEMPDFLTEIPETPETVSDQCGDNLTWAVENGVLTISGEGPMYDYTSLPPWWTVVEPITAVIVGDGVTSVGANAFRYMAWLKTADLAESVTYIGICAFFDSGLEKITIRGENVFIDAYCFFRCRELVDFNVTGSVSGIGEYAMTDYTYGADPKNVGGMKLKRLTLPGENIIIYAYAFAYNLLLEEVVFPGTVLQITEGAFAFCPSLNMKLPEGLFMIGAGAFTMSNIRRADIPDTVIELGSIAFIGCKALESCILPDTLSAVPPSMFRGCENLKSVTIPAGVEWIGNLAFDGCDALETVRYYGSREQWERIEIRENNEALQNADLNCVSDPSHEIVVSYNLENTVIHLTEASFTNSEYVIMLQHNPFFPYEVQFTYQEETWSEWFEEYTDTVEIGGRTFSVEFTGIPRYLRFHAGGGKEALARPFEKTFNNSRSGWNNMTNSLLYLTVDLSDRLWCELENVEMEEIRGNPTVWVARHSTALMSQDDYVKLDGTFKADCSRQNWQATFPYSLSVSYDGAEKANDSYNYIYMLRFLVPKRRSLGSYLMEGLLSFNLTDETRQHVEENCLYGHGQWNYTGDFRYESYLLSTGYRLGRESGFLSIDFNMPELSARTDIEVKVYQGCYGSEKEIRRNRAKDITSQIWRQADLHHGGGYPFTYGSYPTTEYVRDTEANANVSGFVALKHAFEFTLEFLRDGETVEVQPMVILLTPGADFQNTRRIFYCGYLYSGSESWREYAAGYTYGFSGGDGSVPGEATFYLYDARHSAQDIYYVGISNNHPFSPPWKTAQECAEILQTYTADPYGIRFTEKAALGLLNQEEFKAAKDIKDRLFTDASVPGGGYAADFSSGQVSFTIQDVGSDELRYITFYLRGYDPEAEIIAHKHTDAYNGDKYFVMQDIGWRNAVTNEFSRQSYWKTDFPADSYFYNGYQTVFLGITDDGDTLYPVFAQSDHVNVYASTDKTSGVEQISGETPLVLQSGQPIQYSAAMEDGVYLKNYWVTFVSTLPESEGARLFVNAASNIAEEHRDPVEKGADGKGLPVREVFLNETYDYHHDILIANLSSVYPLEDLDVKLVGSLEDESIPARNIRLDQTYTLGPDSVSFLFPRRSIDNRNLNSESLPDNMTKIRLWYTTDENGKIQKGEVSGYLIISSSNGGSVTIKLTGIVGDPVITTETLNAVEGQDFHAVKHVHYSTFLHTSSMYAFDRPHFTLKDGELPEGVTLNANGELYGVPLETGEFTFTVHTTFYDDEEIFDEKTYTLRVADNTTANVWAINDYQDGLTVNENAVSGEAPAVYDADEDAVLIIHSQAEFDEFVDRIAVDGVELDESEYSVEEGSIIATVRSQTLRNAANGSTHTISLENRANKDFNAKMTRTSVNVTVKKSANSVGGNASGNSGARSNSGSSGSNNGASRSSSGNGKTTRGNNSGSGNASPKITSYSISVVSPSNGFLKVDRDSAASGVIVTVTATPRENFILDSVTVTDSANNRVAVNGAGQTRTFKMPARRVTVRATFIRVYRVVAYQRDFGWLSASPDNNVRPGATVTITTHPESGYRAENIRAYDGHGDSLRVTDKGNGTATFTMPSSGANISADFKPIPPIEKFTDIRKSDWFYGDAEWALERGLINGVTETLWAPQDNISTATVVVALTRLQMKNRADAILKEFEDDVYAQNRPWLPNSGEWYYREARWAAASGILTENVFTGRKPLSRAGVAIILRNYLRYRGIQVEVLTPYEFSDLELIETRGIALGEELNGAFQILREANVFQGNKADAMLPDNNSTRAHMAALLHRLSDYIVKVETAEG